MCFREPLNHTFQVFYYQLVKWFILVSEPLLNHWSTDFLYFFQYLVQLLFYRTS